ncbi:MAG: putative Ig domain-containing protein [Mycoplasmataceae bacterium]|jgi:hypothetical protein|nr:putative Ig domain-containing protein [Mycoplasmataceae bacterium]
MDSLFITNVDDDYSTRVGSQVLINNRVQCYDTVGAPHDDVEYSISSGDLPSGLTLAPNTGQITGRLTALTGTYGYTLKAISSTQQTGSVRCKIIIS